MRSQHRDYPEDDTYDWVIPKLLFLPKAAGPETSNHVNVPIEDVDGPGSVAVSIQRLHHLLRFWRNDFCYIYTSDSVFKLYFAVCRLSIPPGKYFPLAKTLSEQMFLWNEKGEHKRMIRRDPSYLLLKAEKHLRSEDSKRLKTMIEELQPRKTSPSDELFHLSRSVAVLDELSWDTYKGAYRTYWEEEVHDKARCLQPVLNRATLRLATRYSIEQIAAFHEVLCHCPVAKSYIEPLREYFWRIEFRADVDENLRKQLMVNPIGQFRNKAIRLMYDENSYSRILKATEELELTIGLLGTLPKEKEARAGWERFFSCITFVSKFQLLSGSSQSKRSQMAYADAFEIQCVINESAYALSKIFPSEAVREFQEKVCSTEIQLQDITELHRLVVELRDKWNKNSLFRRKVICSASELFLDGRSPNSLLFMDHESISELAEKLWPEWSRLNYGICTFVSSVILLIPCLVLALTKVTSWLIMVTPGAFLILLLCVALAAHFGYTFQLYRDYCATPKWTYLLYSRRKKK